MRDMTSSSSRAVAAGLDAPAAPASRQAPLCMSRPPATRPPPSTAPAMSARGFMGPRVRPLLGSESSGPSVGERGEQAPEDFILLTAAVDGRDRPGFRMRRLPLARRELRKGARDALVKRHLGLLHPVARPARARAPEALLDRERQEQGQIRA